ncbi:TadE/TadG family type IV pilus assembly protein [Streptomyces sp. NPDC048659]|uniref:TadE/TadG family type IV pilus assembly protein n=1 Tax=Streptomyces sp. NPDC048659 TaxID=3155489 RepID=UPI00341AD753
MRRRRGSPPRLRRSRRTRPLRPGRPGGRGLARRPRDRGQVAVEYLGFLPLLLLVGLVGVQFGIAAYAAQQAGTAARAAARAASVDDPESVPGPEAVARASVSGWTANRITRVLVDGGTATVTVSIPSLIPFASFDPVTRTAVMPLPDAPQEDRP